MKIGIWRIEVSRVIKYAIPLIFLFVLSGCGGDGAEPSPSRSNEVTAPATSKPGADIYASSTPTSGGVDVTPTKEGDSQSLDDKFPDACSQIGEQVIEYSKLKEEQQLSSIDRIIEAKLVYVAPNTDPPTDSDTRVLMQCSARVHWSAGYRSDLQYYLLIDKDENLRVRWDGIENVSEG